MSSDGTFRKYEHILKSKDFRVVYKKGLSIKNGPLVVCFLPNSAGHTRIGFSVSARNVKLASQRNRAKRLLREVFRKHKAHVKKGVDLIFVLKRPLPSSFMYRDAEQAFEKLIRSADLAI